MLYYSTVEPRTLDVLKNLIAIPELSNFYLVGGTALALRFGHRISVDLDLFSTVEFDNEKIISSIEKHFGNFEYANANNPIGVFGFIDEIKVDLIKHHYFPQIGKTVFEDGIRMFDDDDIIAMKIMAILKRGQKKDFWDIAELLKKYSLEHCIKCYKNKYQNNQIMFSVPQALTYFTDADESEDPVSLNGETWESIKKSIGKTVRDFLK